MDVSTVKVVFQRTPAAKRGCAAAAKTCVAAIALAVVGCESADPTSTANEQPTADPVVSITGPQPPASQNSTPPVTSVEPLSLPNSVQPSATAANSETGDVSAETPQPAAVRLRLPDDRPSINDQRLKQVGIHRYESKRLLLLSDLPQKKVQHLPALADQLFQALEQYFGRLPQAIDDSEFQVTGCIIGDESKFHSAGLMRDGQFTINHGRHFNYRFWMYDVDDDYYRRHLMLHEFTHCFMSCESGMQNIPPLWYFEGMAELFATHQFESTTGNTQFAILPDKYDGFEGWGRISELRRSLKVVSGGTEVAPRQMMAQTLAEVTPDIVDSFLTDIQYAASWAVCWFFKHHPATSQPFSDLAPVKTRAAFVEASAQLRRNGNDRLAVDWLLVEESLREGFDTHRSWPTHSEHNLQLPANLAIRADRDWQDTGVDLKAGEVVRLSCSGRFTINDQPQPWISEPQGVSIEYFRGMPLGCVTAILVSHNGTFMTVPIRVGRRAEIVAPRDSRLWLQLNDSSNSRSNNSGTVSVKLERVSD